MVNGAFATYKIEERSYVSYIKREIHNLLNAGGFSPHRTGEIDIIVSEITSNIIKHADRGELVYRVLDQADGSKTFELYCIDNGPGTNDMARMLKDGASSANTLGNGLGAINRLSDSFNIYSSTGWGTVSFSRSFQKALQKDSYRAKEPLSLQAIQVCFPGEKVCGDGYEVKKTGESLQIFLGDGLGHGPNAHEAVQTGINAFRECRSKDEPVEILRFIHDRVKKTRGLVASLAILDLEKRIWRICGIGNIATRLYQGIEHKNYMSHNGVLGMNIPNSMHSYEVPAEKYQCIVMCSDGIKSRWDFTKFPGILKQEPAIMAAAIYKDHSRGNDDVTVLVGKLNF